jgi:glycyl-tRNA synthetase
MSAYYLEHASVDHLQKHFDFFEEESRCLLSSGLAIPAYVYAILYIYHSIS